MKYKRCCLRRDQLASRWAVRLPSESAAEGELTFIVEMPGGVMVRRIPNASPLEIPDDQGKAVEAAVQDAAAVWGLPDFVYRPALRTLDSGVRELGDGILIVGDLAVVIQVKSRVALSPDPAKEQRWIEKQIVAARRQASGTIRSLRKRPAALVNARGRSIFVDGNQYEWLTAIVIDHQEAPDGMSVESADGTVVFLRRDWEFLFDQLKSTYAVTRYIRRVAGKAIELGQEPARYYELATADANAPPEELGDALTRRAPTMSTPVLPLAPAASKDRNLHLLVRSIFEDIATSPLGDSSEESRLTVLAELDRIPVSYRGEVGRFLLTALDEVLRLRDHEDETVWRMRSFRSAPGAAHLAFAAASDLDEVRRWAFSTWVELRHYDLQQDSGDPDRTTVGVLLTPRGDGRRPWDTTVIGVRGESQLSDEELTAYRDMWPIDSDPSPAPASS